MPNNVYTSMIITGDPVNIKTFAEKHFTNDQLDLRTFITMPEELEHTVSPQRPPKDSSKLVQWQKKCKELGKKYGADNWYDWKMKNWGTKWGTYDGDMDVSTPTTIECNFQTAWSLPEPIFVIMGEMYPELNFQATTVEEGGFFSGTFEIVDGIVNYDGISADNAQWKHLAEEMMGWDFSEDDEDEDVKQIIQAALDGLRSGEVTDRPVTNEIVNFINENIDEFIKFSKPN